MYPYSIAPTEWVCTFQGSQPNTVIFSSESTSSLSMPSVVPSLLTISQLSPSYRVSLSRLSWSVVSSDTHSTPPGVNFSWFFFLSHFKICLFLFSVYGCFACVCVSVYLVAQRPKEGSKSLGSGVRDGCEPPCGP